MATSPTFVANSISGSYSVLASVAGLSATFSLTNTADTRPPTTPTNLTATAASSSQINLSWTASNDNVGVKNYQVERCQGAGCNSFTPIATTTGTSYPDTAGLTANMSYSYRVRATDAAGNSSGYSNPPASATTFGSATGYLHSRPITINNGQVPSPQADFPVLIRGTYGFLAYGIAGVQSPTGIDIKFASDAAGNNVLPYERVKYAANGDILFWVKLDSVSDGKTFYIFYGNANAADQANAPAVWAAYKGVWHLDGVTTLSLMDSTGNNPTGQNHSATATGGKIEGGANFSGSQYIDTGSGSALNITGDITISAWINTSSIYAAIFNRYKGSGAYDGYGLNVGTGVVHRLSYWSSAAGSWVAGNTSIDDGLWHYVAVSVSASTANFYNNGALDGARSSARPGSWSASPTSAIGAENSGAADFFNGKIDEVRIANGVRTSDWIRTEYNNQNSPDSFYTIGADTGGADTQPPTTPTNLTANAASSSQINLSWTASTDIVGVTGYQVERCQDAGCSNFAPIATPAATSYPDTGLAANTSYSYRVRATDAAGNWSGYSNPPASAITFGISGYLHSRPITINNGQVPSPQADFPVLIRGTYGFLAYGIAGVQSPTGIDIKFTSDAAGNNVLPYERVKYAANGEILFWVKLDSVSDGKTFYVFYGNASAADQANAPGVWSAYKGVWHLDGVTTLSLIDSTGNNPIGQNHSATATSGKIEGGANLSSSQYIDTGSGSALNITGNITISAWINTSSIYAAIFNRYKGFGAYDGYGLNVGTGVVHRLSYWSSAAGSWVAGNTPIDDGLWHYVAVSVSGSTASFYNNGALDGARSSAGPGSWTASPTSAIGAENGGAADFFNGKIDEVRIANGFRTGAWIQTEYNNQNAPDSFYAIGAESGGSDTQPPTTPTNLTANAASSSQINLSWTASIDNVGVKNYQVERCQGAGCNNFAPIATTTGTSYPDTAGLTANMSYSYRVRATDDAGNSSGYSNPPASATTFGSSGYLHSRRITINNLQVPSPQSNFPVLIRGTYGFLANGSAGVQSPTGIDIKFTSDAAGNNVLPYERVKYAANGDILFWVQLDSVSDGKAFYIFYGNASAADQANAAAVWSGYKGVWHLDGVTTLRLIDSTGNNSTGQNHAATAASGKIEGGANFSGSQYVDTGSGSALNITGNITISAWINTSSILAAIFNRYKGSGAYDGYGLNVGTGVVHKLSYWSSAAGSWVAGNTPIDDGLWHYVAVSVSGSTASFYNNGALDGAKSSAGAGSWTTSPTSAIGANNSGVEDFFNGKIDEVRVANGIRTGAWIQTEYNNQNAPDSFYTIGAEQ